MVRLQRRTSLLTLLLVVVCLAAGGLGFGWYLTSGMIMSLGASSASTAPGSGDIAYGLTWATVYLAALFAGLLLIVFAAKGTRLICLAGTLLAALAGPFIAVVAVDLVGA